VKKTILYTVMVVLICCTASYCAVINVPGDYSSIQTAIVAASNFDTILVGSGTYHENLDFLGKRLVVASTAGPLATSIIAANSTSPTVRMITNEPGGTELSGFTITGSNASGIRISEASPTITGNIIHGNNNTHTYSGGAIRVQYGVGVVITDNIMYDNHVSNWGGAIFIRWGCDSDTIAYNIIYGNSGIGQITISNGVDNMFLHNNTITGDKSHGVYWRSGGTAYMMNNIIFGMPDWGISRGDGTIHADYNCLYGNMGGDLNFEPGEGNIFADPGLLNVYEGDFRLLPGSPCIDAGHPSSIFNDPDGTRNDMGALPFELIAPVPYHINLGAEDASHVISHTPTFNWSFFDVSGTPSGFQLQVDTNTDWSTADIWSTGEYYTSDLSITYGGQPLVDSVTYFFRLQVYNGSVWSQWAASQFRMNATATTPVPFYPVGSPTLTISNINLVVESSHDPEYDNLVYDFEIYTDPGLSNLAAGRYDVSEQDTLTASGLFFGLLPSAQYYWHARAFDGYEYSDWSEVESFLTRAPMAYHVPSPYATIQAALDAASNDDSVIVGPGPYSGEGNRDLDFNGMNIILIAPAGADNTIIDCGGTEYENHIAIYFHNEEDSTSVIDGFTITNAYSEWDGAIKSDHPCSPTIRNCNITGNQSHGIHTDWSTKTHLSNSTVTDNLGHGLFAIGDATITDCVFARNGQSGVKMYYGLATISNCSFVLNGEHGIIFEMDPPRSESSRDWGSTIDNCLSAYNGQYGFVNWMSFISRMDCCNAYGNGNNDYEVYLLPDWQPSISQNPLLCDTANGDFRLSTSSPCMPANNDCGVLIGALGGGCGDCCVGIRGNINYDPGDSIDISDLVFLVSYMFDDPSGPAAACFEEADLNADESVDISDLTYIVDYMFGSPNGPAPLPCP